MRSKYLSYKRAIETCLNHQYLIGAPFESGNPAVGRISRILIAPYNRILQWKFINDVYSGTDPEKALSICRDGKYEVLLFCNRYDPEDPQLRPKTLHAYLGASSAAIGASGQGVSATLHSPVLTSSQDHGMSAKSSNY